MYEYVALQWRSHNRSSDVVFMCERTRLRNEGWQQYAEALWREPNTGGACIMRRPKDVPRMWTEGEVEDIVRKARRLYPDKGPIRGVFVDNQGNVGLTKEETNG